jgi:hypothetical protein
MTPDTPRAQVIALVASVLDLAVQFGVDITKGQQVALIAFFGVLASIVLGDAHIRNGRAQNIQAIERVTNDRIREQGAGNA